jgi:hypothetical protein
MSNTDIYVAEPTIGTGGFAFPSAYRPLRNSGSVNIGEVAENLMCSATTNSFDTISLTSVLRGGAAIAGAFGLVCATGSALSGVTLMHPLLSLVLIVGSLGFYAMSFARH